MAEDSTRRLLKLFGVAMTDCEDALAALRGALHPPAGGSHEAALSALAAYGRAAREVAARWAELGRLVQDYHAGAQQVMEDYLRSRPA